MCLFWTTLPEGRWQQMWRVRSGKINPEQSLHWPIEVEIPDNIYHCSFGGMMPWTEEWLEGVEEISRADLSFGKFEEKEDLSKGKGSRRDFQGQEKARHCWGTEYAWMLGESFGLFLRNEIQGVASKEGARPLLGQWATGKLAIRFNGICRAQ